MHALQRVLAALLLLMSVNVAHAAGTLVISDAWIPEAPPGAGMMAGYLDMKNSSDQPITVLSAKSARFGNVSLHQSIVEDGIARMRPLKHVVIEPGTTFTFAPGGNHLMLMDPVSAVASGELIIVEFELSGGQQLQASFEVRSADKAGGDGHEHHH